MRNLKSVIIFLSLFLSTSFVAQNLIPIVEDPEVFVSSKDLLVFLCHDACQLDGVRDDRAAVNGR